jgi:hypothetical protein
MKQAKTEYVEAAVKQPQKRISTLGVTPAILGHFSRLRSAAGSRYRSKLERGRSDALGVSLVARTCTICSHPKLVNIDRQLLRGDMLNSAGSCFTNSTKG